MFSFACGVLNLPIVGSFHTDLIDLVSSFNAYEFQKWAIILLEYTDYVLLDSCATTSMSFSVNLCYLAFKFSISSNINTLGKT